MSINNSSASRRSALRAQQEAEARRVRLNRIMVVSFSVIAAIIIGIVGFVVISEMGKTASQGKGEQIKPTNATPGYGVMPYGKDTKAGAPAVVVWEDPQCPACKHTSDMYAKLLEGLASKGEISVEYRLVSFLDTKIKGTWSHKAAMSAAIADTFGKFPAYVDAMYANQPTEGKGYTDAQLREQIPTSIGLSGDELASFQKLYDTQATSDFVDATNAEFNTQQINTTPTIMVNGKRVDLLLVDQAKKQIYPATELTEDALLAYLKKNA